jgi:hypothetical protein
MRHLEMGIAMNMPFVTTVAFADNDGKTAHLQYGVSADNEDEARSELERRFLSQELYKFSILEIRQATSSEAAALNLSAGGIKLLN